MREKTLEEDRDKDDNYSEYLKYKFAKKPNLDLNNLLNRRKQEQIKEKKNNLLIVAGAVSLSVVIIVIFSL